MGCVVAHAGPQEEAFKANAKADFARELSITLPLADKGQAWAQSLLGDSYAFGAGVLQDDAEALKWYQLAAAQGDASAQNNLGTFYSSGRGISQDAAEAMKWYPGCVARRSQCPIQFRRDVQQRPGRGTRLCQGAGLVLAGCR